MIYYITDEKNPLRIFWTSRPTLQHFLDSSELGKMLYILRIGPREWITEMGTKEQWSHKTFLNCCKVLSPHTCQNNALKELSAGLGKWLNMALFLLSKQCKTIQTDYEKFNELFALYSEPVHLLQLSDYFLSFWKPKLIQNF